MNLLEKKLHNYTAPSENGIFTLNNENISFFFESSTDIECIFAIIGKIIQI